MEVGAALLNGSDALRRMLGRCPERPDMEGLRLEYESKCPERFSRKLACRAKAESLREMGVEGMGENCAEVGESRGDGGEATLLPPAV